MKKGWKIFWIVCAGVAGVGVVLAIAGGVMGATFGNVQAALWQYGNRAEQKVERLEDRLDSFDDHDDVYDYDDDYYDDDYYDDDYFEHGYDKSGEGYAGGRSGSDLFSNNNGQKEGVVTADLTGIYELEIDVDCLQVEVREGAETEQIRVQRQNIPEEIQDELLFVRDDVEKELKIDIRNERVWKQALQNRGEFGSLIIELPKDRQIDSISLSIGDGLLNIDHIQARELDIEVGAGVAEVTQFNADSLDIEVGIGEVSVAGAVLREAGIDCGIGKVDYQAAGSEQDYSYGIEVGAGVVHIGDTEYSGLMNEKKIMNGGAVIEVECGAGEVNIGFTS